MFLADITEKKVEYPRNNFQEATTAMKDCNLGHQI